MLTSILLYKHQGTSPKPSCLLRLSRLLLVLGLTLRTILSPKGIHKVHAGSCGLPPSTSHHLPLPGRLAFRCTLQRDALFSHRHCHLSASISRVDTHQRQIHPLSNPKGLLPRCRLRFDDIESLPACQQVCQSQVLHPGLHLFQVDQGPHHPDRLGTHGIHNICDPCAHLRFRPFQSCLFSVFNQLLDHGTKVQLSFSSMVTGPNKGCTQPQVMLTTDASITSWGAHSKDLSVHGRWSTSEHLHISALEMLAVQKALKSFKSILSPQVVLLLTDNIMVMYYINKQGGTKSSTFLDLTLQIWDWCIPRTITRQAIHLPGGDNELADKLSRSPDSCHE
ncbi:uncharacterized protein LOC121919378 [Sceloporus undulatus]|uniref:uncharacterized protein LOC121919378 n=1 Tax=Sceloporus undulatus TaxID=8520 RepID=UPI001C4D28BD|nr:uncharacterized protein LOC121919378 [Sceloporus undulatus]XP_042301860.1 uncharacterized protein LOC121919378 [Sceloporus undulatus]